MSAEDEPDDPSGDIKVSVPAGNMSATGHMAFRGHATVTALRESILDFTPSLRGDMDRFLPLLYKQTDHVLRLIASGGVEKCRRLGVATEGLDDDDVKSLAAGELHDRGVFRATVRNVVTVIVSVLLSSLLAWVIAVHTAAGASL